MGRTSNGSACGQWGNSGSSNQKWVMETTGSYVKIRNVATGLYLDGMGRISNGSACGQYGSSSSNNQQWAQEASGSYYRLRNRATGLYLDGMGRTSNGADLGQWGNSNSYNQQWTLTRLSSAVDDNAISVSASDKESHILIYQNINLRDKFIIAGLTESSTIRIFDLNGKLISKQDVYETGIVKINVNLKSGIYIVKVETSKSTITKKVIIR